MSLKYEPSSEQVEVLPESITLVPAQPDSVENEVPPNPYTPNPEP